VNLQKLNDWLQLVAAIGVIAGLALVAIELRQAQTLTRAQLNSEGNGAVQLSRISKQQDPVASALAMSIDAPESLTTRDRVVLEAYYQEVLGLVIREWILMRRGIYEDDLDVFVALFGTEVLGSHYGRAWWELYKEGVPADIVERIDSYLESGNSRLMIDRLSAIDALVPAETEKPE